MDQCTHNGRRHATPSSKAPRNSAATAHSERLNLKIQDKAPEGVRLDKWLWAARFYKTRALATEEIGRGRVSVNGLPAKPSKDLKVGDRLELRQGPALREVVVLGTSHVRGPAPVAQALYQETAQSLAAREAALQARKNGVEPSMTIEHGRPTKRDRRQLAQWDRWSATADTRDS